MFLSMLLFGTDTKEKEKKNSKYPFHPFVPPLATPSMIFFRKTRNRTIRGREITTTAAIIEGIFHINCSNLIFKIHPEMCAVSAAPAVRAFGQAIVLPYHPDATAPLSNIGGRHSLFGFCRQQIAG